MRWRTVILVDLLAVAGVAAVVRDAWRDAPAPVETDQPRRLFVGAPLPVDDITRIALRRGEQSELVFERRGSEWAQIEPFEHPMDPFSIRQLATLAADLPVADRVDPAAFGAEVNLAALGLDPPAAVLTFTWPSGSTTLHLGRKGVAGRAYLQVSGESLVYVTDKSLHDRAVEMNSKEWRDRQIFMAAGAESERIEWSSGGQGVVIERTGRTWKMLEPVATRLDREAVDAYLQAVGRARHGGFILDEPVILAEFGLENAAATIVVTGAAAPAEGETRGPRVQRLLVGSRISAGAQDRFGMIDGRPVVVRLGEAVVGALFRPAGQLVDPTASGVKPADVKSVRINTAAADVTFERDLDRWVAPDFAGRDVEATLVNGLLETMTGTRAPELELRPYPRELEVALVTMSGFDGRPLDTVRIARDPKTGKWAFENGDNVMRVFPASLQIRLLAEDYGLRPPPPPPPSTLPPVSSEPPSTLPSNPPPATPPPTR